MKLKKYVASINEKLEEFDQWVTPSLGEIRDCDEIKKFLSLTKQGFEILCIITNDFLTKDVSIEEIVNLIVNYLSKVENHSDLTTLLNSILNVLFLVTGKTDNNIKCQFPIYLRKKYHILSYQIQIKNGIKTIKIPRVVPIDKVISIFASTETNKLFQNKFIKCYIETILSNKEDIVQLLTLGRIYLSQKEIGKEDIFLMPIVIFKYRGSITATSGHIPERILRDYMIDWGMLPDEDFNLVDVKMESVTSDNNLKKRKFDFILPFKRNFDKKIFIQCQFYSGDSGSVSHKVLDQTASSRQHTLKNFPTAIFIEFLDGAGYFASLNGDLKKMLLLPKTKDFIQLKSAPLKLRRELQEISFLTILELEHAILRTTGSENSVYSLLLQENYSKEEISLTLKKAIDLGFVMQKNSLLQLVPERYPIIRRYCLLDIIANFGKHMSDQNSKGWLLVAGYKPNWGLPQNKVIQTTLIKVPQIERLWDNKLIPFDDIQWLLDNQFIQVS